jgi:hypothetical protein
MTTTRSVRRASGFVQTRLRLGIRLPHERVVAKLKFGLVEGQPS